MFMKKTWNRGIIAGVLTVFLYSHAALAAIGAGEILSFGTEGKNIVLYVQDPGDNCEIQCQVGTSEVEKIESHPIEKEAVPIETIILLDNSLSVVDKYRPTIRTIMSELAANRMNGEQFTIAVFSDEIHYLVEKCTDYVQVKQAIDGITYNNQETYLTDVLYTMLSKMNKENNTENKATLKRIVIISDGVDNKSIGYTKEELYDALEKTPYPIFTLGCTYKNNNEQLKNMFALSRLTGGESWLLDDVSDPMTIIDSVSALNQTLKVVITPKDKDCDGTRKGINLIVKSGEQSVSDSIEIVMPFSTVPETTEAPTTEAPSTEAPTTAPPATTAPVPTTQAVPEPEASGLSAGLVKALIAAAGILVAGLIVGVFLFVKRSRQKKDAFMPAGPKTNDNMSGAAGNASRHVTQISGSEEISQQRSTMFVWGQDAARTLILEDVGNPIKRFEVSLDSAILVGYDAECQICLNYEETVSGKHCRIYSSNGKIYVENLSRSNGTYMDGKKIVSSAEIYTGCVLKMGNLKMRVEIR